MRYDQIRCEFRLNGAWVDLSPYRLQAYPIQGDFGIKGTSPLDRVASTGTVKLTLLNTANLFTPGHANCMGGFAAGMKFRLVVVAAGVSFTRFYGFVPSDGIAIKTTKFFTTTEVMAVDFMEHLASHELDLPAFTTNKKIGEVTDLILSNMTVQPLSKSLGTGKTTFGAVFDTTKDKTKALAELSKVALAELGYIYLKQTSDSDEVLTVEARGSRSGKALAQTNVFDFTAAPSRRITQSGNVRVTSGPSLGPMIVDLGAGDPVICPASGVSSGRTAYQGSGGTTALLSLSWEGSYWHLIYGGTLGFAEYISYSDVATPDLCTNWIRVSGYLLSFVITPSAYSQSTRILQPTYTKADVVITDDFKAVEVQHAQTYYNRVAAKAYPRKVDATNVVLFNLDRTLRIDGEATVELRGSYKDPLQLAVSVAAYSNVSPVATTDYLFNSTEDGSGTNMTSDLVVEAVHGASGIDYTLRNKSATTGYVTFLQARGKGIYSYRPIERIQEDAGLVAQEGARTLTLDMRYQDGVYEAQDFAVAMLNKYKNKLTVPESITIDANRECTPMLAFAFCTLQVGDKIHLKVSSIGYESDAFIQGIEFQVASGNVVTYTLRLKDAMYDTDNVWILGDPVYGLLGVTTILGY